MSAPADPKLWLFNEALRLVGSRKLSSLTEAREPQRVLTDAYDFNFVDYLLEQGQWKFAIRTESLSYDPDIEPTFGYRFAFTKPDDFKRLVMMCQDEFFNEPLLRYDDVGSHWTTELDTIYLKYVSNDLAYGADMTRWTENFRKFAAIELAIRIAPRLKSQVAAEDLTVMRKAALESALALDAQAGPTRFPPPGRWKAARMTGGTPRRYDRG